MIAKIEIWYDRPSRSWVVQRKDAEGSQIGEADYVHSKREANLIAALYEFARDDEVPS